MHKRHGFTIVELLIVIVVIAILAAITTVSFNGVQDRAKFTQQASNMEKVVRALQLYKADGGSTTDGVAGAASGNWYGGADSVYTGTTKSMRQALIDSGHLPANFSTPFMIALCTTSSDPVRVVLGRFDPIHSSTPQEQIQPTTCTNSSFTLYTDPAQQYKMNYAKVVS